MAFTPNTRQAKPRPCQRNVEAWQQQPVEPSRWSPGVCYATIQRVRCPLAPQSRKNVPRANSKISFRGGEPQPMVCQLAALRSSKDKRPRKTKACTLPARTHQKNASSPCPPAASTIVHRISTDPLPGLPHRIQYNYDPPCKSINSTLSSICKKVRLTSGS